MNGNEIYPNAEVEEIRTKAKKSSIGRYFKQYKKGDFMYTIEKPPFKTESIVAVHIPTKEVFGYSTYFQSWEKIGFKFGEGEKV